jgi:hypothetical protein
MAGVEVQLIAAGEGISQALVAPPQSFRSADDQREEWLCQLLPSVSVGLGVRHAGLAVEGVDDSVADNGGSVKALDALLHETGGVNWWDVGGVGGVMKATKSSLRGALVSFVRSSGGGVVAQRCRSGIGTDILRWYLTWSSQLLRSEVTCSVEGGDDVRRGNGSCPTLGE